MTLQMALLEERMKSEERKAESIAIKLVRMGLNLTDIQRATGLPLQRIEEFANKNRGS